MSHPERPLPDESLTLDSFSSFAIEIKNLTFTYSDGQEPILKEANYLIPEKDQILIFGRTGAGKTTFFRLLTGLLRPQEGSITIGSIPAEKIPDRLKKDLFGYVSQGFEPVLGTIYDQIALGDPNVSKERVEEVMSLVGLDAYVKEVIQGGYEATFEENLFSRGQLQLLSFARALVYDPKILLLDEISANLDYATESKILEVIKSQLGNKTVLSISHRLQELIGFSHSLEVKEGKLIPSQESVITAF